LAAKYSRKLNSFLGLTVDKVGQGIPDKKNPGYANTAGFG